MVQLSAKQTAINDYRNYLKKETAERSGQNMTSTFSQIHKTAEQFPIDFVRDRIARLPKIMSAIIAKDGGRTKY
jgi:hypothetical protein